MAAEEKKPIAEEQEKVVATDIVSNYPENLPSADAFGFDGGSSPVWTSLDTSTEEGKALMLRAATGQSDLKAEDIMAEPFPCQHILAQKVQIMEEKTGEIQEMDRVVLISPEGKTVSFVSGGVMNSLRYIMQPMLYGKPPYNPPLFLKTRLVTTRRGFKTWNLDVLGRKSK